MASPSIPTYGTGGGDLSTTTSVAVGGTLGYIYNGLGHVDLPPGSLGYVYLPALAWLVPPSMLLAPVGARLAHRLPITTLKRIFAGLLVALASTAQAAQVPHRAVVAVAARQAARVRAANAGS